jgi:ParB family transcriptional regulator, chromosome partitioning protein
MNQQPILVPATRLAKSPTNVRRSSDAEADAQLEVNIAEHGVIQNLIGVPVARKKGHYRITAGGRRLDAVHRLIEKGTFDNEYAVPVLVLADASNAIELSLAENFFKLAMNPADACRAFQDVIETENKTPADVARRFGVTEKFVLGRLRLACLAEPIFSALAESEITLDVAIAYASTSDADRQAAVFEQMQSSYYRDNAAEIRRQLASYSYRPTEPKALLVGRDAYLAAGGRIDADLFSDAESERWIDTHIVDHIAEEKLTAAAEAIRTREGFSEVRIVAARHIPYTEAYALAQVHGELPPLSPDEEARSQEIEEELARIEAAAADEAYEYNEEEDARVIQLEGELAAIIDRVPILTDEQKSTALAYIVIGPDGEPRIHEQVYSAVPEDDEQTDERADGDDADADTESDTDINIGVMTPSKPAISQRLADELAMMKTEVLALHVASDARFALDLGTFIMVEAAIRPMGTYGIPSDLRATAPAPRVHGFDSGAPAAAQWHELDEALDRSWTEPDTIEARYDDFCALPDEARDAWLGWAIARTLHAVPAVKIGSAFLDHLGAKLAIDMAAWWRPTARTYFDRITKPAILDLFAQIGGAEVRTRYGGSKKHDLAASAEKLFSGETVVEAEIKEKALAWLPPEMVFAAPEPNGDAVAAIDPKMSDLDDGNPPWHVDDEPAELPEAA